MHLSSVTRTQNTGIEKKHKKSKKRKEKNKKEMAQPDNFAVYFQYLVLKQLNSLFFSFFNVFQIEKHSRF